MPGEPDNRLQGAARGGMIGQRFIVDKVSREQLQ